MPKPSLDEKAALEAISQAIEQPDDDDDADKFETSRKLKCTFEDLEEAYNAKTINWQLAAQLMGITKSKMYHWYRDTYRRQEMGLISDGDRWMIELHMLKEYAAVGTLDSSSKSKIWQLWAKQYDISVFSVFYNNTRRKMLCGKCSSLNARHLDCNLNSVFEEYNQCLSRLNL